MAEETRNTLSELIKGLADKKVLVVGDCIIDEHVYGKPIGLSLETPTMKLMHQKTILELGGAGNVVKHLASLGVQTHFITLIGDDSYSSLIQQLIPEGVILYPIQESERTSTVKRRFWGNNYRLLQIDHLDNREINSEREKEIIEVFKEAVKKVDCVLLVDYQHGLMSASLVEELKRISKENEKFVVASSQISEKNSNHLNYKGVDLICMNLKEARAVVKDFEPLKDAERLKEILFSNVCITLGKEGALLYYQGVPYMKEGINIEEVDPTGAGDAFLAMLTSTDIQHHPIESLQLANIWAGMSVMLPGTKAPALTSIGEHL